MRDASLPVKMASSKDVVVAILTHSGSGIGGGHVSRCRSLSLELEKLGVSIRWIVDEETPREAIPGNDVLRVSSLRSVPPELFENAQCFSDILHIARIRDEQRETKHPN